MESFTVWRKTTSCSASIPRTARLRGALHCLARPQAALPAGLPGFVPVLAPPFLARFLLRSRALPALQAVPVALAVLQVRVAPADPAGVAAVAWAEAGSAPSWTQARCCSL